MTVQRDFRELLEYLNAARVEYVIVGAHALAAHGVVRATDDLDIYVRPTLANAERVMTALREFGFGAVGLAVSDFIRPGRVVQLGVPPIRVDFLTSISGVSWAAVEADRMEGEYGGVSTWFLGRETFLRAKRAAGRPKDRWDIAALEAQGQGRRRRGRTQGVTHDPPRTHPGDPRA